MTFGNHHCLDAPNVIKIIVLTTLNPILLMDLKVGRKFDLRQTLQEIYFDREFWLLNWYKTKRFLTIFYATNRLRPGEELVDLSASLE